MTSCVDTNVLLDVLTGDPMYAAESRALLIAAYEKGALAISEVVYSELAAGYESWVELDDALNSLSIDVVPLGADAAFLAGRKWAKYRTSGGTRIRVLPDFFIGAHALLRADCLLTRDRGFYATYFPELKLLER